MDEAEKYQQRLQAIAEKRQAKEEEDRVRRETEEEWLKLAQRKRKSLRDQWLMEPIPSSTEASGTGTAPWSSTPKTEESAKEQSTQKDTEEDDDQTTNMDEELPSQILENSGSLSGNTEEPAQANSREEEKATTTLECAEVLNPDVLQNGQLERSVLGVLEIQVERDQNTGVTTIKCMAPIPAAALESSGEAVFDDGWRTVHAVGGVEGNQHSEKELSQILNAISEVGMQTILDGTANTCNEDLGGEKGQNAETGDPEGTQGLPEKQDGSLAVSKTDGMERCTDVKGKERDGEGKVQEDEWEVVHCRPEEGLDPVVLSFLGFTQVQQGPGLGYEDDGEVLKVEQVFIVDEEDSEMGTSGELSPNTQHEAVACRTSCPEETPPEVTLQASDTGAGAGKSVALKEMNSVSEIMDSEETTEDSSKAQQCLTHISNDKKDVPEGAKDVSEQAADEEEGRLTARTAAEAKGVEKMEIRYGSNLEDEVFEDVPLDGKKETSQTLVQREAEAQSIEQEPEILALMSPNETPNRAEAETTKSKTCQCCAVM